MKAENFNQSWKFYRKGEEEKAVFLQLPHDAMIEEERIPNLVSGDASGYFPGGSYVYEKKFFWEEEAEREEAILYFDGVYQKASVYVNDKLAARQNLGYTHFQARLTELLQRNAYNVIRVEVDNTQVPNSRWYTGSGIYREVILYTGGRQYILPQGIRVETLDTEPVCLNIYIETRRLDPEIQKKTRVDCRIFDVRNREYPFRILEEGWQGDTYRLQIQMEEAELWCEENPNLYRLQAELVSGQVLDREEHSFGIRTLVWNPEQGLLVNGKSIKLRGACIHHDNGILGAKEYRETAYRKIKILKECGYNAVRTAHNEPSRWLLEACDSLGMYMMAEFSDVWRAAKNDYDYALYFDECAEKDLSQMVRKCRPHPSVILYSLGNEIYDTKSTESGETCRKLRNIVKSLDETRPVTLGLNVLSAASAPKKKPLPHLKHSREEQVNPRRTGKGSPLVSSKFMNTVTMYLPKLMERVTPEQMEKNQGFLLDCLDMAGLNYGTHLYTLHNVNPTRMIVHTETFPGVIGRTWKNTLKYPWVIGDFMWTGWDYLGECGIGVVEYGKTPLRLNKPYPCISGGCGSVNLAGEIETQGYYTKAVYGLADKPYIGVHPLSHAGEKVKKSNWRGTDAVSSWAWGQEYGKQVSVEVYSRENMVELFQNGKSLGKKQTVDCKADFTVRYEAGRLEAVAYDNNGKEAGRSSLESDDPETRLSLWAEQDSLKEGEITYVFAEIVDSRGIRKVWKEADMQFQVKGCGKLLASGSGNPWARYPYIGNTANSWYGSCAVVIQAESGPGTVWIEAKAEGMSPVEIQIPVLE